MRKFGQNVHTACMTVCMTLYVCEDEGVHIAIKRMFDTEKIYFM